MKKKSREQKNRMNLKPQMKIVGKNYLKNRKSGFKNTKRKKSKKKYRKRKSKLS